MLSISDCPILIILFELWTLFYEAEIDLLQNQIVKSAIYLWLHLGML